MGNGRGGFINTQKKNRKQRTMKQNKENRNDKRHTYHEPWTISFSLEMSLILKWCYRKNAASNRTKAQKKKKENNINNTEWNEFFLHQFNNTLNSWNVFYAVAHWRHCVKMCNVPYLRIDCDSEHMNCWGWFQSTNRTTVDHGNRHW